MCVLSATWDGEVKPGPTNTTTHPSPYPSLPSRLAASEEHLGRVSGGFCCFDGKVKPCRANT